MKYSDLMLDRGNNLLLYGAYENGLYLITDIPKISLAKFAELLKVSLPKQHLELLEDFYDAPQGLFVDDQRYKEHQTSGYPMLTQEMTWREYLHNILSEGDFDGLVPLESGDFEQ